MSLSSSLSSVESALTKVFGILDKSESKVASIAAMGSKFADSISKVTAGASGGSTKAASGGGMMPTSLGNVPPIPGGKEPTAASFGGVQGGAAGSGGGDAGGGVSVRAGGVSPGRAGAIAAGVASAAYNLTPGLPDSLALMGGLFPTSYAATGPYDRMATGRRISDAIGVGASGALDPAMATTLAAARGFVFSPNDSSVDNLLKGAEFAYTMTGMSNSAAVSGLTDIYRGGSGVNDRLMSMGVMSLNSDGSLRDIGDIVYEIMQKSNVSNMTEEEFNKSMAMGYLGQTFNYAFGDSPELFAQAQAMARTQFKSGNRQLRTSDGSAMKAAQEQGLEDSPFLMMGKTQSAQFGANVEASEGLMTGAGASEVLTTALYKLEEAVIKNTGVLGDFFMAIKGGWQGTSGAVSSNSTGGNIQGRGTSTHDNVHAILAAGEYVINSRAAALIGKDTLDQMNSLGHEFGAGFASPAPVFLNRGGQPDWTHPFPHQNVHVSSGFRPSGRPGHAAIDLNIPGARADEGKAVLAAAAGTVSEVTHTKTSGGKVFISHAGGYTSGYHHLAKASIRVKKGDSVTGGQVIGVIGIHGRTDDHGTGSNSTGAHLHFSLKKGSRYIDPSGIIKGSAVVDPSEDGDYTPDDSQDESPLTGPGSDILAAALSLFSRTGGATSVKGLRAAPFGMLTAFSMPGLSGSDGRMRSVVANATSISQVSAWNNSDQSPSSLMSTTAQAGLNVLEGIGSLVGGAANLAGKAGSSLLDSLRSFLGMSRNGGNSEGSGDTSTAGAQAAMGNKELLALLQRAGFKGERLREAWAIVMRESSGRPGAHNPDRSTGDNSYGLFQINMLGKLGPERLQKFARYGVNRYEDLFDPWINAQVAAHMSQKGNNWSAWRSAQYGRSAEFYKKFPAVAREAGLPGYAHGSEYISRDQVANLHQGELVMPAAQAQMFRQALQEVLSGARGRPEQVNVTLNIERASDEEAERFAKKVVSLVRNEERHERLATL
jgi:murein DD-endopeptidase MepM/ murein hydrolase activator NlpD